MMAKRRPEVVLVFPWLIVAVAVASAAGPASAQVAQQPEALEGVGVTEHLGETVPLDLTFKDENGNTVRLGDYFESGKPVVLTLNYYACPMLCTIQLNELIKALKMMDWTPGNQFELVTVSFDPTETPTLARLKKQTYMKDYGRPEAAGGWHFLTGDKQNIEKLTEAVGFTYRWDEASKQYVHTAVAVVLSPEGTISRYLKSVIYDPTTMRIALAEAKEGKYRSTADQVLLFCYVYDADAGRYVLAATNIMRAGAILTALILGTFLLTAWLREARKRRAESVHKEE